MPAFSTVSLPEQHNTKNNQIMISAFVPIIASFFAAFVSVLWLHPKMVSIAKAKNITDNPDKRKLQREPVPVLGGVAVFFGIVMGTICAVPFCECSSMTVILALLTLMLYTGTMDDILGLTPKLRFMIETIAVCAALVIGGYQINDFHSLWGIGAIPQWAGVPLTVFAAVGIINAINLIDGVDGLSSGYCIMACSVFAAFFIVTNDTMMAVLAISCIGALIPFFVHNVFGKSSKMFIGDGGTLVMGMIMSLFVLRVLDGGNMLSVKYFAGEESGRFGFIPFTLAVMAIPVFDTLRVMTARIIKGVSPFNPDKTHLHHAFIGLGLSHFATTLSILALNGIIIIVWFALYLCGAGVDAQLYSVLAMALTFTAGMYYIVSNYKTRTQN